MNAPEDRYARLSQALLDQAGVTRSRKKGFGSSGQLQVNDKIFAMLVRDRLVLAPTSALEWLSLAREAMAFVTSAR